MQTFVPASTFEECARLLDSVRLNKQITETKQIINVLSGQSMGYKNHPAVHMWQNNITALRAYGRACLAEWRTRGGGGHTQDNFIGSIVFNYPWWWGDKHVIASHQSRLNHKWQVDALRQTLPRGHWEDFRQLYCQHLPKAWNMFTPSNREELKCIFRGLCMPSPPIYHHFKGLDDQPYIWPCIKQGEYKVKRGNQWYNWVKGEGQREGQK